VSEAHSRAPAARIAAHWGERISEREPIASATMRQVTPRCAARQIASATREPLWSVSQM
jgi:type IV secretory pathway ATPase VirB11/archaellum biosynthesis ATPase